MPLKLELANLLNEFLTGQQSLSAFRGAMMRVRVEQLESLQLRDKNFLYEFETRYAQLQAGAITEYQFKELVTYAAVCETSGTNEQTDVWFYREPEEKKTAMGTNIQVTTGTCPQTNRNDLIFA